MASMAANRVIPARMIRMIKAMLMEMEVERNPGILVGMRDGERGFFDYSPGRNFESARPGGCAPGLPRPGESHTMHPLMKMFFRPLLLLLLLLADVRAQTSTPFTS